MALSHKIWGKNILNSAWFRAILEFGLQIANIAGMEHYIDNDNQKMVLQTIIYYAYIAIIIWQSLSTDGEELDHSLGTTCNPHMAALWVCSALL